MCSYIRPEGIVQQRVSKVSRCYRCKKGEFYRTADEHGGRTRAMRYVAEKEKEISERGGYSEMCARVRCVINYHPSPVVNHNIILFALFVTDTRVHMRNIYFIIV